MRIFKAFLPLALVVIIRVCIDYSYIPPKDINFILKNILFSYSPYIVVIIFCILYIRKFRRIKMILIISSIIVFLNILLSFGPFLANELFNTSINFIIDFPKFSIIFFLIFAVIAFIYSISSKNNIAITFAFLSIALAIYVEIVYIPNLEYNPYTLIRELFKFDLYRSIGRPFLSMMLISLPIFTGFFSLLKTTSSVKS